MNIYSPFKIVKTHTYVTAIDAISALIFAEGGCAIRGLLLTSLNQSLEYGSREILVCCLPVCFQLLFCRYDIF